MMQLPIFEELRLTVEQAEELACYWKRVGDGIGIIDSSGYLTTSCGTWNRPMANRSFKKLRDALKTNPVSWIIVMDNQIVVDFSKLRYNLSWIKSMLRNQQLGVSNSEDGLKLFQKRETSGKTWYQDLAWRLRGVTVENLGFENSMVVSLSQNQDDPDSAEWLKLYFAA